MAENNAPIDDSNELPAEEETPDVVAHSEDGEDTPWCGVHQEKVH